MERSVFQKRVYQAVRNIPKGKVATYGQIALLLGEPNQSRRVGKAVSNAPPELELPCHRVVGSTGRTAPGWPEQAGLLKAEGVIIKDNGCVDIKRCVVLMQALEEAVRFEEATRLK